MNDWPKTRDEVIARFTSDENPEHREMFTRLVDEALSRPDPSYDYLKLANPPNMTVAALCNAIYEYSLVEPSFGPNGWIDTEGRFWSCSYAAHERLLELMDMNSIEQELEGWIKIRMNRIHARFFPNDVQSATLMKMADEQGIKLDWSELEGLPEQDKRPKAFRRSR